MILLVGQGGMVDTSGMNISNLNAMIAPLCEMAVAAGNEIMRFYRAVKPVEWHKKIDNSPVTEADLAADCIIANGLQKLASDIPAISEESFDGNFILDPAQPFWLVDPLDGTKEFLNKTDDFTVNIGLIVNRLPVLGIIHAPVFRETYYGIVGQQAWRMGEGQKTRITVREPPEEGVTIVSSRYNGNSPRMIEFMAQHAVSRHYVRGSSYKFCEVAQGNADLYPQFGNISEWDTAAGHAILNAAGGSVSIENDIELHYGKPGLKNPPYLAFGFR